MGWSPFTLTYFFLEFEKVCGGEKIYIYKKRAQVRGERRQQSPLTSLTLALGPGVHKTTSKEAEADFTLFSWRFISCPLDYRRWPHARDFELLIHKQESSEWLMKLLHVMLWNISIVNSERHRHQEERKNLHVVIRAVTLHHSPGPDTIHTNSRSSIHSQSSERAKLHMAWTHIRKHSPFRHQNPVLESLLGL